jgi:P-type conjugative transfer protein TrbJ
MKKQVVTASAVVALVTFMSYSVRATGMPVFDASALVQTTTTALNSVRHTLLQVQQYAQQIQQYELQFKQYIEQVKQGLAPIAYVWQEAQQTVNDVMGTVSMFQGQSTQLQAYLSQFQSVEYWRNISPGDYQPQSAGSIAQKQANDALIKGIVLQQEQLKRDAATLEQLQSNAQGAEGQMQALQSANQLAALQSEQLMQIRALLIQEQQALAARQQTLANDEAQKQAANEAFQQWTIKPGSGRTWAP